MRLIIAIIIVSIAASCVSSNVGSGQPERHDEGAGKSVSAAEV